MITLSDKVRFIESVFGKGRISRDCRNFDVRCPVCASTDRSKLKLSILTEDDRCHCWVCGYRARTLWNLVSRFGTRDQLLEYRDRFLPEGDDRRSRCVSLFVDETKARPKLALPKDFRLLATSRSSDPDVMAIRKYLVERHVSERDTWYFRLGHSDEPMWRRRVIMPSFDASGELNYFVGRAVDRFRKPKYENPPTFVPPFIFNEMNLDWTRQVVLCEGPFDLMKCGDNAVPLLGSDLNVQSALFGSIVANKTPVALALDADMRLTKGPRIAQRLYDYDIDVTIVTVPDDPGSMSKQAFRDALTAARPFDWRQVFQDRLEKASRVAL